MTLFLLLGCEAEQMPPNPTYPAQPTDYKLEIPMFVSNDDNRIYGSGHNSFTISEDGAKDILIYHARSYKKIKGDPLFYPNRHARAQVIH